MIKILKENPRLGIALVCTTTDDDSVFEVRADDEIVLSTRVEAAAAAIYDELFDERNRPSVERRNRERAIAEANALYADRVARTKDRTRGKGGKGGRGGV